MKTFKFEYFHMKMLRCKIESPFASQKFHFQKEYNRKFHFNWYPIVDWLWKLWKEFNIPTTLNYSHFHWKLSSISWCQHFHLNMSGTKQTWCIAFIPSLFVEDAVSLKTLSKQVRKYVILPMPSASLVPCFCIRLLLTL